MDGPYPDGMVEEWAKVLATLPERGKLTYDEVFSNPVLFPLQRRREMAWMMRRAADARSVVEVGADKGGSVFHWAMALPRVERIAAVEIRGCPYKDLFERAFPWVEFLWQECGSEDAVVPWTPDVLFVDGDKTRMDLDFDRFQAARTFLHDVQDDAPHDAYLRLSSRGLRCMRFIDTSEVAEADGTSHGAWLKHWNGRSCGVGEVLR